VDAYPGSEFNGEVTQVRLQPTVVQNVTTYSTIINVPNPDFRLKPGMTANLKIQIERREDAIRVPNAAIRFRPTNDMFAALNQPVPPEAAARGGRGGNGANGGGRNAGAAGGGQAAPAVAANSASGEGGSAPTATQAVTARGGDNGGAAGDQANGGRGRGGRRGGDAAAGNGGGNGGGRGGGRGGPMTMDRFMAMQPDQQRQYVDRAKQRGDDVKEFEAALDKATAAKTNTAETIDALFPPLVVRDAPGRVWTYEGGQMKSVSIRTGITDGSTTELVGGGLESGAELVTGMVLPGQTRQAGPANGNPLLGGRGPGGPGGPGGGGRGPGR
jgi:HlyD family secretion protein